MVLPFPSTARGRAVLLLALLCCLAVLPVQYGTLDPDPAAGAYPANDELADDADRYLGDRVVVYGAVAADPTVVLAPRGSGDRMRITVVGGPTLAPGTPVEVFGVLEGERRVRATNVLVRSDAGFVYAYLVSFLAGLWTLSRLVRDWRFDRDRLCFRPREPPRSLRAVAGPPWTSIGRSADGGRSGSGDASGGENTREGS